MSTFTLKPIANSSIVVIDDSFVADYTYFKNDETFIRPDNAWTKFIEKDFNAFTDLSNRWSIRFLS